MKVQFLGGAEEVGRLAMLLKNGDSTLLFDYGFIPSKPPLYPLRSPRVDAAFITHAHVDHCGMLPVLSSWPETGIYATSATISTANLLLDDSIKVGESEGTPPPYDRGDIKNVNRQYRAIHYGDTKEFSGTEITYHSAGHIPGATMFEINSGRTALFTGDLNTLDTNLVFGAKPVKCDTLLIEGTYSGKNHPDRLKTTYNFIRKIEDVLDRGGVAIIPAFAVSRTQELLMSLQNSKFDIWLDGMGSKINTIYLGESGYLRSSKKFRRAVRSAEVVRNRHDRAQAATGEVIVTTSGMLDGGPVVHYLGELCDNPKNAVILTGYQVEGSNGRRLVETGTVVLHGNTVKVDCEVCSFDFSAHAGHNELVKFIDGCSPKKVVFMHSDDPTALVNEVKDRYEVVVPKTGEEIEI